MMRRLLVFLLISFLIVLQYRFWLSEGGVRHRKSLEVQITKLEAENKALEHRNSLMRAEVNDLKKAKNSVEEIARRDLGMIREGEVFYLVPDREQGQR